MLFIIFLFYVLNEEVSCKDWTNMGLLDDFGSKDIPFWPRSESKREGGLIMAVC